MKIVQLANFYSPTSGGLRTAVDVLGRGYSAAGHDRVLVVPGVRGSVRRIESGLVVTLPGVPVSGGYRMLFARSAVLGVLDRLAPDSVEVSDKATLLAVGDWARARGVGSVLFSHERLDTWLPARFSAPWRVGGPVLDAGVRRWNRGMVKRFDTVVVTSAFAQHEFDGLEVGRMLRIPLGVDLDTFRPAAQPVEPAPGGQIRLIYAGRLSLEKNPQSVIGAVARLVSDGVPVHLDVYGDGAVLARLRKLAVGLPVTFHGYLADRVALAARLGAADVAFAPSTAETFGLSVLEALACGTPVITADRGGAPELLAPAAGAAVPATPEGLAGGVLHALSSPVAVRRAAARRRAEQFPWSATISSMLDVHLTHQAAGARRLAPPVR